jgi:hypothetical protein
VKKKDDETLAQWRKRRGGITRATFAKWVRLKRAPKVTIIGGTYLVTARHNAEWERREERYLKSNAARLERERRSAINAAAARRSAASPNHISKRGPRKRRPLEAEE